jgi:alcohol dehydrogenase
MWRDAGIASFHCPTKIIFGVGAHRRLGDLLREQGVERLLLLLDPALEDSVIHQKVTAVLAQSDVATVVFSDIPPDFNDGTVRAVFERGSEHGVDAVVAIGGQSTIEIAKALDFRGTSSPLISIPTTAGTRAAVSSHHAMAILDPLAVNAMSANEAAYAGIDSFADALESYLSNRATVFSDALNAHAMTLIARSIRPFVADRNDEPAALDMLCGSSQAAISHDVTGLGNVSCMATAICSLLPVTCGLAKAICLPHVAAFNVSANPKRYARIAAILGIDGGGWRETQSGAPAIHGLRTLCADLGFPTRLRDIGATEEQLEELARRSLASADCQCNPRQTSEHDFLTLFRAAF